MLSVVFEGVPGLAIAIFNFSFFVLVLKITEEIAHTELFSMVGTRHLKFMVFPVLSAQITVIFLLWERMVTILGVLGTVRTILLLTTSITLYAFFAFHQMEM